MSLVDLNLGLIGMSVCGTVGLVAILITAYLLVKRTGNGEVLSQLAEVLRVVPMGMPFRRRPPAEKEPPAG